MPGASVVMRMTADFVFSPWQPMATSEINQRAQMAQAAKLDVATEPNGEKTSVVSVERCGFRGSRAG
jgi:hypothetical protein